MYENSYINMKPNPYIQVEIIYAWFKYLIIETAWREIVKFACNRLPHTHTQTKNVITMKLKLRNAKFAKRFP